MTDHYYSVEPNSEHNYFEFTKKVYHDDLNFKTDAGVFSRHTIDYGSLVLLKTISELNDESILDLGSGYGPIGISIAKEFPNTKVKMVDVNKRSVQLTRENIERNNIANAVGFWDDVLANTTDQFDLILTNPPVRAGKKVVNEFLTQSYNHLNNDGKLLVVLQKKQGAPSAQKFMKNLFGNAEIIKKDRGYYILQSVKHG